VSLKNQNRIIYQALNVNLGFKKIENITKLREHSNIADSRLTGYYIKILLIIKNDLELHLGLCFFQ
jgi:hypothetical protein